MSLFGAVSLVACNGGGSSGGGAGDQVNGNANMNGTPPQDYSANLTNGGSLLSITNVEIATNQNDAILSFGANNLPRNTTVNFTVSPAVGVTGTLPTLNPASCTFESSNPQTCELNLDTNGASAGNYIIQPNDGQNLTPITLSTMSPGSLMLNGTYNATDTGVGSDCSSIGTVHYTLIANNSQICVNFMGNQECQPNAPIPIPSGANPFQGKGFLSNVKYANGTINLYWTPPYCPGTLEPVVLTKTSNATSAINVNSSQLQANILPTGAQSLFLKK